VWRLWLARARVDGSVGTPGFRRSWGLPCGLGSGEAAALRSRFSSSMGTVYEVE
jgi:hypothetical protein